MKDAWPQIRAALMALHLFAILLMAVPSPSGGLNRNAWSDPTVQDELDAWRNRFAAVGLTYDEKAFEELLWTAAKRYEGGHRALTAPFRPYYRHFGTWQSWRMFVAPHRYPSRLHIELMDANGRWKTIYRARDPHLSWRSSQLDHDRMRAAIFRYGWKHYRTAYGHFGTWVATQAAADFPDAKKVQIRFWKYRTASPAEVRENREPIGEFRPSLLYDLAEHR